MKYGILVPEPGLSINRLCPLSTAKCRLIASKALNFMRDSQEKRFRLSTTVLILYSMSQKS